MHANLSVTRLACIPLLISEVNPSDQGDRQQATTIDVIYGCASAPSPTPAPMIYLALAMNRSHKGNEHTASSTEFGGIP